MLLLLPLDNCTWETVQTKYYNKLLDGLLSVGFYLSITSDSNSFRLW